jgi:hypothetical protein
MNDIERRPIDGSSLFWGLILIAFGILFMLDRFGIDVTFLFRSLWPLLIILFGVSRLIQHHSLRGGGLGLIVIGVWLQIATLHLFGLTFNSSWPLLLIALGAWLILRALADVSRGRRHLAPSNEENHEP